MNNQAEVTDEEFAAVNKKAGDVGKATVNFVVEQLETAFGDAEDDSHAALGMVLSDMVGAYFATLDREQCAAYVALLLQSAARGTSLSANRPRGN